MVSGVTVGDGGSTLRVDAFELSDSTTSARSSFLVASDFGLRARMTSFAPGEGCIHLCASGWHFVLLVHCGDRWSGRRDVEAVVKLYRKLEGPRECGRIYKSERSLISHNSRQGVYILFKLESRCIHLIRSIRLLLCP